MKNVPPCNYTLLQEDAGHTGADKLSVHLNLTALESAERDFLPCLLLISSSLWTSGHTEIRSINPFILFKCRHLFVFSTNREIPDGRGSVRWPIFHYQDNL